MDHYELQTTNLNPLAATELPTQLVRLQIPIPNHEVMPCPSVLPTQVHIGMTWHSSRWPQFFDLVRGKSLISRVNTFNVQLGWMNSVEASVHDFDLRVRSTTWEFSANSPIGGKGHLYTTYILPFGGLYATYHLLGEPETTIDHSVEMALKMLW